MNKPSFEYILSHWLSTTEAAEIMDLDVRTVSEYCGYGKFNAMKIGGRWYVDPASARSFQKSRRGGSRKKE